MVFFFPEIIKIISFQEKGSSSPHPGGDKEHSICGLVDGIGSVSAGDLSLAGKSYNLRTTKSTYMYVYVL